MKEVFPNDGRSTSQHQVNPIIGAPPCRKLSGDRHGRTKPVYGQVKAQHMDKDTPTTGAPTNRKPLEDRHGRIEVGRVKALTQVDQV